MGMGDGADSEPYYEPPSKRLGLTVRGRPRDRGRGIQRAMNRERLRTRGGRRDGSPKVPKFLVAVSTKDIELMAPNVEWEGSIGNPGPNVEHNSRFDYFKMLTDNDP